MSPQSRTRLPNTWTKIAPDLVVDRFMLKDSAALSAARLADMNVKFYYAGRVNPHDFKSPEVFLMIVCKRVYNWLDTASEARFDSTFSREQIEVLFVQTLGRALDKSRHG